MNKPVTLTDGITSLTANLGTERDKAASVYYVEPVRDEQQLQAAYRTSWLANKIVDIPPFDSFRRWRSWQAAENQIELLEAEEKRLDLKAKMLKTETLARLYGGAALYFDLGDDASKPAPKTIKKGQIRFLTVLSHRHIAPGEIEQDPMQPTFGLPKWYTVVGAMNGEQRIHPSRLIIRYGGSRLDMGLYGLSNGVWGDSVLYALLPAIQQFDGTTANIASLVFESKVDVIKTKGLMNLVGDPIQEQKLLERYRLAAIAKGNNGMLLLDGDSEEYEQKNSSFASLPDLMDRFAQNAAGAADIPLTRLFGRSPGGMNATGESDLRNYYDRIQANQNLSITPSMEIFDELMIQSALGSRPPAVHFIWTSLWQLGESERAEIGAKNASTIKTMVDTGLLPDEALAESLVNMMVEASVMPGLDAAFEKYGMPVDVDEDPDEDPDDDPDDGAAVVGDSQPRAPKGTPNGGQWVKLGGGGGVASLTAAEMTSTPKYSAEKILSLTEKHPSDLTHYEKKKLAAYKKELEFQKAVQNVAAEKKKKAAEAEAAKPAAPKTVKELEADMIAKAAAFKAADVPGTSFETMNELSADYHKAYVAHEAAKIGEKVDAEFESLDTPKAAPVAAAAAATVGLENLPYFGAGDTKSTLEGVYQEFDEESADTINKAMKSKDFTGMTEHEKIGLAEAAYNSGDTETLVALYKSDPDKALNAVPTPYQGQLKEELEALAPTMPDPKPAAPKMVNIAKENALAAVATKQYPAEKVSALLYKNPSDLTHYEKKKVAAYKKALVAEATAPVAPTAKVKADKKKPAFAPSHPLAQAEFEKLGASKFMKAETVEKLATGEWKPDPKKPYQAEIAKKAQDFLQNGGIYSTQEPSVAGAITASNVHQHSSGGIKHKINGAPPPLTGLDKGQSTYAGMKADFVHEERYYTQSYTGGQYNAINGALRQGKTHSYAKHIDAAIAKGYAKTNMVVARGVSAGAMAHLVASAGGELKVGAVFSDKGYISTTRKAEIAGNFAGNGYGLKINVPKGRTILAVASFSNHVHEDEFILPRGSSFRVTNIDGSIITVDLV